MKSKVTKLTYMNLGPFTFQIRQSETMADGEIVVDVAESTPNPGIFGFQVWKRTVTDSANCEECIRHEWRLAYQSPPSELRQSEEDARHLAVLTVVQKRLAHTRDQRA